MNFREQLADKLECPVEEVAVLLGRLPPTRPNSRRDDILAWRLHGLSVGEIAASLEISRTRVSQVVKSAVRELTLIRSGRGELSARLRNLMDYNEGSDWTFQSVAPHLTCSGFLKTKNAGRHTLMELHGHLREAGLTMKCGCPEPLCSVGQHANRAPTPKLETLCDDDLRAAQEQREQLARQLVALRVAADLSPAELAIRIGTSPRTIIKVESHADVPLSILQRYCLALGHGVNVALSAPMERRP